MKQVLSDEGPTNGEGSSRGINLLTLPHCLLCRYVQLPPFRIIKSPLSCYNNSIRYKLNVEISHKIVKLHILQLVVFSLWFATSIIVLIKIIGIYANFETKNILS